jgi:tRNA(Ile)-lysidine synthase TilS/MesJ
MTEKEKNEFENEDSIAGSGCEVLIPFDERKPLKEIERLIVKQFRKKIWAKFIKAIKEYNLIKNGDKIAVAISGGKDSMLMAKLFQELKRHRQMDFELEFIVMDPGYHENIKELLIDNCKYLNIPIKIFESGIFRIVDHIAKDYPCYMCAKMRRGALYSKAAELGCNKLALGHHFNDVIETTLLNIFYSGNFKTMLPKLKSTNFENMELIRPMYFIQEEHIERFTQISGIWPLNCACMVAAKKTSSKRYEMKELIKNLKSNFKDVDKSIFNAAKNVNMDAILGWEKSGKKYSYLDFYDEEL